MADRSIHYESAFEAYLRSKGIPYVAVDEAKKALFANAKLKSFDFVVYSKNGPNLLIDVKGRQVRDLAAARGLKPGRRNAMSRICSNGSRFSAKGSRRFLVSCTGSTRRSTLSRACLNFAIAGIC